ncbi:MAG: hypothetical protein M1826_002900 [Phylliscum demangeonii]|nr:MAG: hypothetical protein M1826_002900 [Phylliscum demangeonii]
MAWRSVAASIHPQLPLSRRESEQLLLSLTSIFRRHLEGGPVKATPSTAHGRRRASFGRAPGKEPGSEQTSAVTSTEDSRPAHDLSFVSFDRHLKAVLKSPLFSMKPDPDYVARTAVSRSTSGTEEPASQVVGDPVVWFRHRVAMGTATLRTAERCLAMLVHGPSAVDCDVSRRLKSAGAGSEVLHWLQSRPGKLDDEILKVERDFRHLLTTALVCEGHQKVVLRWVVAPERAWSGLYLRGLLLRDLLILENRFGGGANAAADHFLRALDYSLASGADHVRDDTRPRERASTLFERAGKFLVRKCSTPAFDLSPDRYEHLLRTVPSWSQNPQFTRARLLLVHYREPDPSAALQLLRDIVRDIRQSRFPTLSSNVAFGKTSALIQLALNTVPLLLERDALADAAWVLACLQEALLESSTEADESAMARSPPAENPWLERTNLRLLGNLKLSPG